MSYNPTLMALLWESTATRETKLLKQSLEHRHQLPQGTSWINYLRGHDDIGWSFDNGDAWAVGINPDDHRNFLNQYYTGSFDGSFARGVPFQHNTDTGDMRVSGTMASLAGLEQAVTDKDKILREMAIKRIRMLYGVLSSIGGIPLIFMGEEWGLFNDYAFTEDPEKAEDSRWIHRPKMDWSIPKKHRGKKTAPGRIFKNLQEIFAMRKEVPALVGNQMRLLPIFNDHTLAYLRWHDGSNLIVFANFSEKPQQIELSRLRLEGFSHFLKDVFTGETVSTAGQYELTPYQLLWLLED
jgi:amylosucrase